eukprot:jgi/Chlat1/5577/Chrsp369S05360
MAADDKPAANGSAEHMDVDGPSKQDGDKQQPAEGAVAKKGGKKEKKEEELSEEDLQLKTALDLMVERVFLADVLSVLAMTMADDSSLESLKFRLQGSEGDMVSWGHEYVRNIAGEIGQEYGRRQAEGQSVDDLMALVRQIVPFHFKHNAEPEAVDLLLEVESVPLLLEHMDETNYKRTCLYLLGCASYVPDPDDKMVYKATYDIFMQVKKYTDAMGVALRMNNVEAMVETFKACSDSSEKKQLAYILASQGVLLDLEEDDTLCSPDDRETLMDILRNNRLSEGYLTLARDLDVMEPKTPEDIYKTHLIDSRSAAPTVDSARQNLAATFVNAFVNAGFGTDKLMTTTAEGGASGSWLFKNKEHGKISAAASLGSIAMWDVEGGLPQIDKYLYSNDQHVVAGALLAVGVVNCGVRNECDPAYALLYDSVNKESPSIRIGAIMGLGLAYAGTQKEEVFELLSPVVTDSKVTMDVAAFAAVAMGLVFSGTCHQEAAQSVVQALMERSETELQDPFAKLLCLGLGLLFLGKQDAADATVEVAKTLHDCISKHCQIVLETCAYANSGNVLKVQKLLGICGDHLEGDSSHQAPALLGIAIVGMAEELGQAMAVRSLEHLLQYGDPSIRKAVPLGLALLSISNPQLSIMDTLSRLSHDSDSEVSQAAILGLGLVCAGTNNARVAGILRNLSSYYYKDANMLFLVRLAQGLVHLGKGLLTLNPYHHDRSLLSPTALAGLLVVLHACFDMKTTILGKYHYILYFLTTAMQPRMLMTLDEDLKPLPVSVRVGQAVDVVGQAGRPKTVSGFQTHTTPVLLGAGERAELTTDKYKPLTPVLEGFVILRKNPDYIDLDEPVKK